MIMYMYIAPGQGLKIPWRQNLDVYGNIFSLRSFVASLKRICSKSDFIKILFMNVYMFMA